MDLLWQKVAWLCGMFLITATFALLPLIYFRNHAQPAGPLGVCVLGMLQCAAAGVFLSTCLLDLVPDYLSSIASSLAQWGGQTSFPLDMFIMAAGFLLVLLLEQLALSCCSHGNHEAPDDRERQALLDPRASHSGGSLNHGHGHGHGHGGTTSGWVRVVTFACALSIHSAFEGLACGLQLSATQLARLCGSLFLHKALVALGLGLELWGPGKTVSRPAGWLLAAIFSLASPLGMLGGALVTRGDPVAPGGNTMARSVLEGVSAGTFVFVTFVEILPQGLQAPGPPMLKMLSLLLGFSVVTATLFIEP
ncbi:LOW QUALITY PROTEIN: zinc transporter ZIP1-like [Lampetra fluviatilis]